jgi:hypothetical protein
MRGFLLKGAILVLVFFAVVVPLLVPRLAAGFGDDYCAYSQADRPEGATGSRQEWQYFPPRLRCIYRLESGEEVTRLIPPRRNGYVLAYGIPVVVVMLAVGLLVRRGRSPNA